MHERNLTLKEDRYKLAAIEWDLENDSYTNQRRADVSKYLKIQLDTIYIVVSEWKTR